MNSDLHIVLSTVLTNPWTRLKAIQDALALSHEKQVSLEDLSALCLPSAKNPERLATLNFTLSPNPKRARLLARFVTDMTQDHAQWAKKVHTHKWSSEDSKQQAHDLFLQAEKLHISGVVAYAIVKASMTLRGFEVPAHLSAQVICAKKTRDEERAREKTSAMRSKSTLRV